MHITVNYNSCLSSTLPLVQTHLAFSQASDHQGSQWEKTPLCTSASTKPADGSFQNNKQKYSKPQSGFRLVCGFINVYYYYFSTENYYATMQRVNLLSPFTKNIFTKSSTNLKPQYNYAQYLNVNGC